MDETISRETQCFQMCSGTEDNPEKYMCYVQNAN